MKIRPYFAIAILFTLLNANSVLAEETIAELKQKIADLQAQVDAHNVERKQTARHLEILTN